jgi:hypothetical protein
LNLQNSFEDRESLISFILLVNIFPAFQKSSVQIRELFQPIRKVELHSAVFKRVS